MSRTKIAYFDPFGVYRQLSDQIASKLPLVNLHWNPPSRPLRSIPTLDVDLIEETVVTEQTPKHQMLGLSSAPYLKIMFVRCDDSETYRNSVRAMIREWLNNSVNSTRDPTEWLVVHYVPHGAKGVSSTRFKSSVYDKVRADFNSGSKKDRCIQIREGYSSDMESMEVWSEMMTRIKERVLEAFSRRVDLYEDEVRKLEAKKNVMGWNFGTFFYMKEGLALSFENISLYEDALILYDELEANFASISRQKNVTFFSSVGFDFEKPPQPILDLQHGSEMRRQIMSNEISLFDFHCYLFGRQAYLLMMVSKSSSSPSISAAKIGELYVRLRTFVTEMVGLLESNKKDILMVSEWTFNVIMEFEKATDDTPEGIDWLVSEGRGEMRILCRKALETIAAAKGWFIKGPLAEVSLQNGNYDENYEIYNETLKKLLVDEETFYAVYREFTVDASQEFDLSNRVRTVNRLSSQLALLDFQLGNYEKACQQLENIPNMYSRQGWDLISTSLLSIYIKCLVQLDKQESILSYSLDLLCQKKYLHDEEVNELVGHVQRLCNATDLEVPLDNLFKTKVLPEVYPNEEIPGYHQLMVKASTTIGHEFPFDSAEIILVNIKDSTDRLTLICNEPIIPANGNVNLTFGKNYFVKGRFRLHSLKMRQKKLTFVKNYEDAVIVDIFETPYSLHTELRCPKLLALPERRFALDISTVEKIESCSVKFKAMSAGVRLSTGAVNAVSKEDVSVKETGPLTVTLTEFSNKVTIEIPFIASFDTKKIQIRSTIEYKTENGSYTHIVSDEVDVMLAIDVNVHDFFKRSKLLSKFSVSCKNGFEPVRVLSATLKPTEHFEVDTPHGSEDPVVAFPGGPVSYVYSIKRTPGQEKEEELQLSVVHRYIRDECAAVMWRHVSEALEKKNKELNKYSVLIRPIIKNIQVDLKTFALEGWFDVSEQNARRFTTASELDYIPNSDKKKLFDLIIPLLTQHRFEKIEEEDFENDLHDLKLPVSIPQVHVIHGINLDLPAQDHFVIGQVIQVTMTIESVRIWRPIGDKLHEMKFTYDLNASHDAWAITGKGRSHFIVPKNQEESKFEIKFSMIPLKTGKLQLPRVIVTPSIDDLKMELDHMNGGETALVVPEFDRLTISW